MVLVVLVLVLVWAIVLFGAQGNRVWILVHTASPRVAFTKVVLFADHCRCAIASRFPGEAFLFLPLLLKVLLGIPDALDLEGCQDWHNLVRPKDIHDKTHLRDIIRF